MIDPTCSPEVKGIIAYMEATGVPYRITSTFRPGAITASGNPSRHGRKLACDFAGPAPGRDTAEMGRIFDAFVPIEGHLNELIYAGPQVGYNIKRGKRVGKYAQNIHHDHVHVAVDPGIILAGMALTKAEVTSERIDDTDGREDMAEPVGGICAPGGGVWVLTRDGGVRAYNAPFHGSYPGLPEEWRQGERTFVDITVRDDGAEGYMLHGSDGALYRFP